MTRIFYTDGSCFNNGKDDAYGGWCYIEITKKGREEKLKDLASGYEVQGEDIKPPTSIRMELKAVINALMSITTKSKVILYTDSAHIVDGLNRKWYRAWNLDGKRPGLKTPENRDLWYILLTELKRIGMDKVKVVHIPGHRGHRWQELCDSMAKSRVTSEVAKKS